MIEERPRGYARRIVRRAIVLHVIIESFEHRNAAVSALAKNPRLVDEQGSVVLAYRERRAIAAWSQSRGFEGVTFYALDAGGYSHGSTACAFGEGARSDFAKPFSQGDIAKCLASGKRLVMYLAQAVRGFEAAQRGFGESPLANFADAFRHFHVAKMLFVLERARRNP